jgi:GT2 family glycosyltransferase
MTTSESEIASSDDVLGASPILRISVVIPTYQRERVLVETIHSLLELQSGRTEILVVDQTEKHEPDTQRALVELERTGKLRWIRLSRPSITHAMNVGLQEARNEIVLFLDDDIVPDADLISSHARAHGTQGCDIVAGQVLQPGEEIVRDDRSEVGFRFCSNRRQHISELMGGNFSIKRDVALKIGGFDENFVHVAYRFEAEFASRALATGQKIWFEPEASIRHLKCNRGGTRSYGKHLMTIRPSHSVGAYYYLLRTKETPQRMIKIVSRPFRAIRTRHHFSHPWWIPGTLFAEAWGFLWAVSLAARGPRLIQGKESAKN